MTEISTPAWRITKAMISDDDCSFRPILKDGNVSPKPANHIPFSGNCHINGEIYEIRFSNIAIVSFSLTRRKSMYRPIAEFITRYEHDAISQDVECPSDFISWIYNPKVRKGKTKRDQMDEKRTTASPPTEIDNEFWFMTAIWTSNSCFDTTLWYMPNTLGGFRKTEFKIVHRFELKPCMGHDPEEYSTVIRGQSKRTWVY